MQNCLQQSDSGCSRKRFGGVFGRFTGIRVWQGEQESKRAGEGREGRGDTSEHSLSSSSPSPSSSSSLLPPPSSLLSLSHLSAYLQESCYWVARKMALNLAGRQSAADLFQTAIARVNQVLKGFNPQFSSNLKSYAEFAFSNIIKDTLRKQQEADICTDWALLQKTSQKRVMESLEHAGLDTQAIAAYVLAWNCFKELYMPGDVKTTRKLAKPEAATWQAIARLYHSQRLSQLSSAGLNCSPERLEQWMAACAKAIRAFRYPGSISIDKPVTDQDSVDWVERLPGEQESLLTEMVRQEEAEDRQAQLNQIDTVLVDAIAQLDSQTQQLLQAYYGQDATQQHIAQLLNIKQYTVSRRLTSVRQSLLKTLVQWSQDTLHIALTSDVLSSMSTVLDEWLSAHYRRSEPHS
ncbi:MAG: sigma-70 family RNA polymerase sigma factor [Leptolyngbyaceae cyanobacterium RU_5_1]|nr:sigma-70 family RNA polymerase sigma factor [Leptolyngbyaceae cyanobacterium RU_5_1]